MVPLAFICTQLAKAFTLIFQVRADNSYQECYWLLKRHIYIYGGARIFKNEFDRRLQMKKERNKATGNISYS